MTTLTFSLPFSPPRTAQGRPRIRNVTPPTPVARVPRVARFMALAIESEALLHAGHVASYAELARLHQVTRARVTQIMNLLHLAPDVQEAILNLVVVDGRDPVFLRDLQPIAREWAWEDQRKKWKEFYASRSATSPEPQRAHTQSA
jgi:hypothetical protein